ncbi:MAG: hypothetical protein HYU28_06470 [Actinobacteria bacterium]|nr:hypothetical protein [Actinomycetota bacterium]
MTAYERIYARALALGVRPQAQTPSAHVELLELAHGDPHALGRARDLMATLAHEQPDTPQVRAALSILTDAWLVAISAA